MFEGKYVAVAMSVSSQVNWACNFIIGLVFPYMNEYLGPYSFAPFACVLLGCFIFTATVLPETQVCAGIFVTNWGMRCWVYFCMQQRRIAH